MTMAPGCTNLSRQYPAATYFALTFLISWACAFAVASPHIFRHEPLPQLTGILLFPAMLLGPSISGMALTLLIDGKAGLDDLLRRMTRWRLTSPWYAVLALPPILILAVLFFLRTFISTAYAPNRFLLGVFFGIPAGWLEEIGWMGFAFPKLTLRNSAFSSAVLLGLFWSLWHLPAVNFLGTATPHGNYWFLFFLAFALAMTAMRVLIAWTYTNTRSLLLAQLLHISSTASLVVFSPPAVSASEEVLWYAIYGVLLWLLVLLVRLVGGRHLISNQL